jgi:hypothetical protein
MPFPSVALSVDTPYPLTRKSCSGPYFFLLVCLNIWLIIGQFVVNHPEFFHSPPLHHSLSDSEADVHSDPVQNLQALNPCDWQTVINLVDLFVNVLSGFPGEFHDQGDNVKKNNITK